MKEVIDDIVVSWPMNLLQILSNLAVLIAIITWGYNKIKKQIMYKKMKPGGDAFVLSIAILNDKNKQISKIEKINKDVGDNISVQNEIDEVFNQKKAVIETIWENEELREAFFNGRLEAKECYTDAEKEKLFENRICMITKPAMPGPDRGVYKNPDTQSFVDKFIDELNNAEINIRKADKKTIYLFYKGPGVLMAVIGAKFSNRYNVELFQWGNGRYYYVSTMEPDEGN